MSQTTGMKTKLETALRLATEKRFESAIAGCFGAHGLKDEERHLINTLRDYMLPELVPELVSEVYRVVHIPDNFLRVEVQVEGDGLGWKGPNLVAKINAPDTHQNTLDLRAMRGTYCTLISSQGEMNLDSPTLNDLDAAVLSMQNQQGQADLNLAAPEPEPEAELVEDGEEATYGVPLFYPVNPEGEYLTPIPMPYEDAQSFLEERIEEAGGSLEDGWKLVPEGGDAEEITDDVSFEAEPGEGAGEFDEAGEPTTDELETPTAEELAEAGEAAPGTDAEPGEESATDLPPAEAMNGAGDGFGGEDFTPAEEAPAAAPVVPEIPASTGLTENQQKAADMFRDGASQSEVMSALDIGAATLQRWRRIDAFVKAATPQD